MTERKVAVVTGGSSGVGFEMAKKLAGDGYALMLVARGEERLRARREELVGAGHDVEIEAADVSSVQDMERVAAAVREKFGRIDFLIVNAGVVEPRALYAFDDMAEMKATIDVDLWGAILTTRLLGPMIARGGRLLFVSSGFAFAGAAGYATYCAAKAGLVTFAEAMRRELSAAEVSVYVACPADMDTPQFHYEKEKLPSWLNVSGARGDVMPAETAARKILRRCRGDRLVILITLEVWFLRFARGILPERVAQLILDKTFPAPSASDIGVQTEPRGALTSSGSDPA